MAGLMSKGTGVFDYSRPISNQGRSDAAFVDPVFVASKGGIARIGPGKPIAHIRIHPAGRQPVFSIIKAYRPTFGTAAVIGEEHYQRIFFGADFLDFVEDLADAVIHPLNLRCVDGHFQIQQFLVLFIIPGPRRRIAWGHLPLAADKPHFYHPLIALLPQFVPALQVFAFILCDILRPGVQRPVRSGVCQVKEERFFPPPISVDKLHGVFTEGICHIELTRPGNKGFIINRHCPLYTPGLSLCNIKVICTPADDAVILIEAAVDGPMWTLFADMPFAGHKRPVATRFEGLCDSHTTVI